jgi:hypothetical protein
MTDAFSEDGDTVDAETPVAKNFGLELGLTLQIFRDRPCRSRGRRRH